MNSTQEVLNTKTGEKGSQINYREVLPCAIQGIKPRRFRYFEVCNIANFDKYDKGNLI